ncbi:hypothetical protein GRX03_07230 [Halovenus sp. WSH3]|uniref:Uncharacterized protein n=1 Tax=Halovenus carboxidivorans TaxID=2692199 RepID=A0A6B0T092_9EURY|nr:hypothetical protein [Halovenus carboxidivorans]MXR51394.1 hypothetical protein [Halovenus carboxidivorans]
MAAGNRGIADAIKYDLTLLHETWMELFYPRQRNAEDTVLGKYEPEETWKLAVYRLVSLFGVLIVGLSYPLLLAGYFVRFQARKLNVTAARIGLLGVIGVFVLLWGGLVALIWFGFQSTFSTVEIIAIGAAGAVAVVSSALSFGCWQLGGRGTTVFLAYPFAMTALFLPPVVAALFHPVLEDLIIARSDELARDLFFASPDFVQEQLGRFDRQEAHHVIIWFVFSFPIGWILGLLVSLADLIRPTGE